MNFIKQAFTLCIAMNIHNYAGDNLLHNMGEIVQTIQAIQEVLRTNINGKNAPAVIEKVERRVPEVQESLHDNMDPVPWDAYLERYSKQTTMCCDITCMLEEYPRRTTTTIE